MGHSRKRRALRAGFLEEWDALVGARGVPAVPRRRGRPARVPLNDVLAALTFHVMQGAGSLGDHFGRLFPDALSDSAVAERRARLPWAIFDALMRRVLRPKATRRPASAFWRGWRVLAVDGTHFNLTNTPQMRPPTPKARTRRGHAAFATLTTAVLLEVGLHNPVAAAIGRGGESEWALAQRLLAHLPARALLLGDRLYGVAAFVAPALAACQRVGSHFLLRASRVTKPQRVQRLADGTRLLTIALRDRQRPGTVIASLTVREIRARVGRAGQAAHDVRLWTSLLDPATAPALELAQLYTQRWEHELYFRELKRVVRRTDVLQSHTAETAAQEVAALILVSAILATQRQRAAGTRPPVRISFAKLLDLGVRPMWLAVDLTEDIVSEAQLRRILRKGYARLAQFVTPARRARTCARAVRQPTRAWPRLLETHDTTGDWTIALT